MNRRDLVSGLFWLGISIFVCIESIRSEIGTFHVPGPGFLPFWAAVILGTFSIILVATSSLKKGSQAKIRDLWRNSEWKKVIWALCALFLYLLALPRIGYLIATLGLMVFLLSIIERSKVWIQGLSAFAIALASYVIFFILLDIKLPKGIFGF